jgi:hypothetical protein
LLGVNEVGDAGTVAWLHVALGDCVICGWGPTVSATAASDRGRPVRSDARTLDLGGNRIGDDGALTLLRSPLARRVSVLDLSTIRSTARARRCGANV